MSKKVIVAVSGGPDSMYLLYKLYKKRKVTPIVAHVNYNFRPESVEETSMVIDFCKANDIYINVLDVTPEVINEYKHFTNKQHMAREIRYDFFMKVADKHDTKEIYIGHHKDDFIETAIMQEGRSQDLPFYGIEYESNFKGYEIIRPLLGMWKADIESELNKKKIPYMHDQSNFSDAYERNRIRKNLASKSIKEKKKIYKHYKMLNQANETMKQIVDYSYKDWEKSNFDRKTLLQYDERTQEQLLFRFLIYSEPFIKINMNKIKGALEFIKIHKGKEYRLMESIVLVVKDSKIKIYNK